MRRKTWLWITHLPVLAVTLEHHGILRLADIALLVLLDLGGALLGLDAVILREGALVAGAAGMGEEVRANRLNHPLAGARDLANRLEILLGLPS